MKSERMEPCTPGAQEVRDLGVSEAASAVLYEDPQQAQGAVEGVFIHLQFAGEFGGGAPIAVGAVGYA
jgi:hypothetical protein